MQLEFRAMGCHMLARLDADAGHASRLAEVPRWFEAWEQALSRFRPDSELNQLNRCAGQWVRVSPILWEVIQYAIKAARWSDGLISPTVLNALEAIGYDRSFEAVALNDEARSITPQPDGQWAAIERRSTTRSLRLPPGARIDLGGADRLEEKLKKLQELLSEQPALLQNIQELNLTEPSRPVSRPKK